MYRLLTTAKIPMHKGATVKICLPTFQARLLMTSWAITRSHVFWSPLVNIFLSRYDEIKVSLQQHQHRSNDACNVRTPSTLWRPVERDRRSKSDSWNDDSLAKQFLDTEFELPASGQSCSSMLWLFFGHSLCGHLVPKSSRVSWIQNWCLKV